METLHQDQQSQTPEGSPKCDIWDGLVWRHFTGTGNIHDPPFMSIPGALAFPIYVEWFNAHGKSTRNHPWSKGANCASIELPFNATHRGSQRAMERLSLCTHLNRSFRIFNRVAILTAIADVAAMHKLTGFISHSGNHFCNFCTFQKAQIVEIGPQFHYTRSYQNHNSTIEKWVWVSPQQRQGNVSEYGVQYSILEDLLYWDATRIVNLDIMHNLILGIVKDYANFKLFLPESNSKIYFRSRSKSNDTKTSDSNSMTSNSSLDKIKFREACSLRRDAAKIIN
ncbi:hypothetical protein O181_015714 [Austropuccinia psidii MF-1]|uniref:Uncharacterized protein n=1 Tax=Austropuccinia psidii MF-1 TaxID=1389203 RepID=A0A9Q3C2H8_9BASI|nr:hypothetical protein [Austropuccinia psidii MF-1]